jgi:cellulose biosynthesis protein BcsQ
LAIDNDHQGNLTQYFGYNPIEVDATTGSMFHVYIEERPLRDIILGVGETVKLAPASLSLAVNRRENRAPLASDAGH